VDKGVLYRETHSQVWNRGEQGDRRQWWCLRKAKARVLTHGRPGRACGGIDLRLGGRRGGFLLRGNGETVGDEVFHRHDHGEGLDLTGNATSGHIGAEVGDFPEAGQNLFAVQVEGKRPKFPSGDKLGFGLRLLSWIRQRD
jgi:hypothetical protein